MCVYMRTYIPMYIYICRMTIEFYFWEFQASFTFRISDQICTETSGRILISINGCCIWTTSENTTIRAIGFESCSSFPLVFLRIIDLFGKISLYRIQYPKECDGTPRLMQLNLFWCHILFKDIWIDRQPSWRIVIGTGTELALFFLNILATGDEEQENQRIPVLFSVKEETTAPGLHII